MWGILSITDILNSLDICFVQLSAHVLYLQLFDQTSTLTFVFHHDSTKIITANHDISIHFDLSLTDHTKLKNNVVMK